MDDMVGVRLGVCRPVLLGEKNLRWVRVGQVSASSRYYSIFNELTDINKLDTREKKSGIIVSGLWKRVLGRIIIEYAHK